MNTLTFLCIILFLIGLYFYAKTSNPKYSEGLTNNNSVQAKCPNMLIQKGSSFYLFNSKLADVPGVNPIEFNNLEDYVEFLDWQQSQGINCPVLYLQQSFDAQGGETYKVRPSVSELQGGLPPNPPVYPNPTLLIDATRNDPPYNINSFPAYDQSSQYVGATTPLDAMNILQEKQKVSPDAMDPNWGGAAYTQSLINSGYYSGDNVSIYVDN
jgi:hypothetical protein